MYIALEYFTNLYPPPRTKWPHFQIMPHSHFIIAPISQFSHFLCGFVARSWSSTIHLNRPTSAPKTHQKKIMYQSLALSQVCFQCSCTRVQKKPWTVIDQNFQCTCTIVCKKKKTFFSKTTKK